MERDDDILREGIGIKIEQPMIRQKLGVFYFLILFLSLFFISMTIFVLYLEGSGTSLPAFLRFHFG